MQELQNQLNRRQELQDELNSRRNGAPSNRMPEQNSSWLSPGIPIGADIASGIMSLAGRSPQEKEMIRNIAYIATGQRPNVKSAIGQGIGEMAPLAMSGVGAVPGLLGTGARIAGTAGYGAAMSPEDRSGGALKGALIGAGGEALPAALSGIGRVAEKINPVKFAKSKISEILENYKLWEKKQKEAYSLSNQYESENVLKDPMISIGHHNPEEYLGFKRDDLSPKSKIRFDKFTEDHTFGNLHKLQSQLYKDTKSYKNVDIDKVQTAESAREMAVERAKEFLKNKDPKALAGYEAGARITREELKPYLGTPDLRKLISEKIKTFQPKKLESVIRLATEKEHGFIPKNHHLRKVLEELQPKLETSEFVKTAIPENLRKWSPKFVKLAQMPSLVELLKNLNLGYQPIKQGVTGHLMED